MKTGARGIACGAVATDPQRDSARNVQVVHALGARIVGGSLAPGTSIPIEEELVGELGVGRSAVREGVKVLAGKGLLETRRSAGTIVRPRESGTCSTPTC